MWSATIDDEAAAEADDDPPFLDFDFEPPVVRRETVEAWLDMLAPIFFLVEAGRCGCGGWRWDCLLLEGRWWAVVSASLLLLEGMAWAAWWRRRLSRMMKNDGRGGRLTIFATVEFENSFGLG